MPKLTQRKERRERGDEGRGESRKEGEKGKGEANQRVKGGKEDRRKRRGDPEERTEQYAQADSKGGEKGGIREGQ